ncbi:MAG TPA: Rieske 2Fe-2S domain-containing protein [Anaerolineales bacterium]|nr:Rieske 2Fe-2S domain-containing protein [Anaerolineales bacterium]
MKGKQGMSRRQFLGWAWAASLVGLFGQAGAAMFSFFKPRLEPGAFGGEIVAGALEEFQPGTVSYVRQGRFYISRLEDGGVLAMWQRCTHLGCTVPWRQDEGQFHCPCHSSLFNRQGEVIGGPAPRPLDIFPVSLKDGDLMVDTSRPIERQGFDTSQVFFPT